MWSKAFVGFLAAACYVGVILTGSRGGYFGVVASLVVFCVLGLIVLRPAGTSFLLKFGGTGLVLIATVVVAAALLMQESEPKQRQLFSIDQARLGLWRAAIEQWKLAPIVGTGTGTYLFYGREFRDERLQTDPIDAHNDYLHLLCEYGAIGAAAFPLLFLCPLPSRMAELPLLGRNAWLLAVCHLVIGSPSISEFSPRSAHMSYIRLSISICTFPPTLFFWDLCLVSWPIRALSLDLRISRSVLLYQANSRLRLPQQFSSFNALGYFLENITRSVRGPLLRAKIQPLRFRMRTKPIKWEQQNPKIFFYLGRALIALGRDTPQLEVRADLYKNAVAAFDEARNLVPLDGSYPLEIASVYDQVGLFREAEEMFTVARERDPRSTNVFRLYQAHLAAWKRAGQ